MGRAELDAFLAMDRPDEQIEVWNRRLCTRRFRLGVEALLSVTGLRAVYASPFLAILPPRFGRVLLGRLERGFAIHPNRTNPYARALFLGEAPSRADGPATGAIELVCSDAASYLEGQPAGSFSGFTLSNILDGATAGYRERLFAALKRASAKGGVVVLRSFGEPAGRPADDRAARDRLDDLGNRAGHLGGRAAMTGAPAVDSGCIRQFTAEVAAAVAAEHARDPMGELLVWLHMALRREASVGEIYGTANLGRRLERVRAPRPMMDLLRTTISNIWAQEKAHAAYLEAVLCAVAEPPGGRPWLTARLDGFLGAMEGQVLSGRTSPSNLQRTKAALLLAIGRRIQGVPDFVSSLTSLSFREFCQLNAELEITAVHGYERMLTLLAKVETSCGLRKDTTLDIDVSRMVRDERFHNEAFVAMAETFGASGDALRPRQSYVECAERLAEIRGRIYGVDLEPESRPA